jgi:hypothetical protein
LGTWLAGLMLASGTEDRRRAKKVVRMGIIKVGLYALMKARIIL